MNYIFKDILKYKLKNKSERMVKVDKIQRNKIKRNIQYKCQTQ